MQDSLLTLLQLQQIDQRLQELEHLKAEIPRQIEALTHEYTAIEQALTDKEHRLADLHKDRRQHERDLEDAQEKARKYQGQLLSVKTNKEYDALQMEIQAQKVNVTQHEDTILRLMTEIEDLSRDIDQTQLMVTTQRQRITAEQDSLQHQLTAVDEDVQVVLDERRRTLVRINKRVVSAYERVRKGKSTVAVVPIKKGACGGCFNIIPLQRIAEIRRMDRLMTCESCGRILVPEPQE